MFSLDARLYIISPLQGSNLILTGLSELHQNIMYVMNFNLNVHVQLCTHYKENFLR